MMETKTTKTVAKATQASNGNNLQDFPKLPMMLQTLQFLRTAKGRGDREIHPMLDKAFKECKQNDSVLMLERVMLHIGDISRQHNLLKEMGIKSPTGGAQERAIFRSCLRWWEKNIPESFKLNLRIFVEFTLYENLMYYQNKTDRKTGNVIGTEVLFPMPAVVHSFLAEQIRRGRDINLIARHLPKYYSVNQDKRTTKKRVNLKKNQTHFNYQLPKKHWVKINGEYVVSNGKVLGESMLKLNAGDIISYPRNKQNVSIRKQEFISGWIENFCKVMNWSLTDYSKFRANQATPEQAFSSKSILKLDKPDFNKFMDRLTSGQRFRVAKMLAYKDGQKLVPHTKWGKLGEWYIQWETNQEKVAQELRTAAVEGDEDKKKLLMKDLKVKATGMQTVDMLVELIKGGLSEMQINNTYQAMLEKMDLIANIFPILDGSGSMNSHIAIGNTRVRCRDIAYAMCIAFSTRNPVEEFRNTYGWFSNHFTICGRSKFKNEAPNPHVDSKKFTKQVPEHQVISAGKSFTENLKSIYAADTQEVASTNMFSNIEFFVGLVKSGKYKVEELPSALLYITDNERNTGKSPKEAVALAASIGWYPLQIFWGLTVMSQGANHEFKDVPNALFVGGFNEGSLSQILRGIKGGTIDPETELWSVYNDPRYSVLNVA